MQEMIPLVGPHIDVMAPRRLCNAGGVVVFEWVQELQQFFWDEAEVMSKLYHVLAKQVRGLFP